ncbi:S-layer homology domain-containing protein [Bhargavaea ginsengi]|uniref:S-layer homology domain-containing protein n=1 Tax=Bhargavaea ginsengi TaxID=426757 RepID=A0A1H7ABS5_9BACL|nr:S-layer homology domain-containing protein [Bhargavaea ginsengi]SEJ63079.1 S-layer homology domain-containing protein [Bhargavaea ginsengi]
MRKQTKKKMIGAALTVSLAAGTFFAGPVPMATYAAEQKAPVFSDLDPTGDDYAHILALAAEGIVKGFPDGTYKPGKDITRQQAAKIIAGTLNLDTKNAPDPGYTDVNKNSEYYGYIAALTNAGVVSGSVVNGKKVFKPAETLSRAQMSKIIAEAYELPTNKAYTAPFSDVTADEWHAKYVQAIYDADVTKGQGNGLFGENNAVKRGQMASFIHRAQEQDEGRREAITQARDRIFTELENDKFHDTNGSASVSTSFNRETGAFNVTVYNPEGAVTDIQNTGFFSNKMPELGVTAIKIADNAAVDITENPAEAKATLIEQAFAEMEVSGTAFRASDLPITLTVENGGYEFEQPFKLNVSTHSPK